MKILSADNIRKADKETIEKRGITSFDLMIQSMEASLPVMLTYLKPYLPVVSFCGTGNNGGDGLVLTYLLRNLGFDARAIIAVESSKHSAEFELARSFFSERYPEHLFELGDEPIQVAPQVILVDALFGSGLNRPLTGKNKDLVTTLNSLENTIISLDIPSGLPADFPENPRDYLSIKAFLTVCLQTPKETLFFPETGNRYGRVEIVDIGIDKEVMDACNDKQYATTEAEIKALIQAPDRYQTKHQRGHACVVGGFNGKTGALYLAAQAAFDQGAGLVTAISDEAGIGVVRTNLPECMMFRIGDDTLLSNMFTRFTGVGIGPGLGTEEISAKLLHNLVHWYKGPMVLDADAINLLAENPTWREFLPAETIITPHEIEFERLTGCKGNRHEKIKVAKEWSIRYNLIVVLKGAFTCTTFPDGSCVFNMNGTPLLAQGGSGDRLTGYITGLQARGYSAAKAATLGVYLHGAGVGMKELEDNLQFAINV